MNGLYHQSLSPSSYMHNGYHGMRDDDETTHNLYPHEYRHPTVDDSMMHFQMQAMHPRESQNSIADMNEDEYSIDDLNEGQYQYSIADMNEDEQMAYFEEMEHMRQFEERQQMNQFEEIRRMREMEQSQEVSEMQQMNQFEQSHHRRQRFLEALGPRASSRRLMQNDFASELEYIDKPELNKRALPKYYNSTRTINARMHTENERNSSPGRHSRRRSVGRVADERELRDDDGTRGRDYRKTKRTSPSRNSTRQRPTEPRPRARYRSGSHINVDSEILTRSRSKSQRKIDDEKLTRSRSKSNRNMVPPRPPSRRRRFTHNVKEDDESISDQSWNKVATPAELLAGIMEKDGWLNQATDVVKRTFNMIFDADPGTSSDDNDSSGVESGSDGDSFGNKNRNKRHR
jgi:hypothetical protein